MTHKRDVPKLNKENFPTWKNLMRLHISSINDSSINSMDNEYVKVITTPLTIEQLKLKQEHNQAMLEISSSLSYAKFDEIKGCDSAKKMCDALHTIYGGDANVLRAKFESLRGKFDDMRMQEGENVAQYCSKIKDVNSIRGATSKIDDDIVLRKVLRTLLAIYVIRVFAIQELRCVLGNTLSLEGMVCRLTTFELSNFDNYKPKNMESTFKAKLSLKESNEKKKKKTKYVSSGSEIDEEDVDQLEALLAMIFHRGKGNFKGKLLISCFNFNEVGHIVAR